MTRAYFNRQADTWDEKVAEKDAGKLAGLAARLDLRPGDAVLDVGTGTGVFVPYLLRKIGPGGKLVCLDTAEKMLDRARAKNFKGNIEYVCGDIAGTGFEDETFDAAVCYSSFPHFQDKAVALREINRVLKKGGRLAIGHTSGRMAINNIHKNIPEVSADLIPDNGEMRSLLSQAGFGQINLFDESGSYLATAVKILPHCPGNP